MVNGDLGIWLIGDWLTGHQAQKWVCKSMSIRIRRRLSRNFGQRKWFGQTKRKINFFRSLLARPIERKKTKIKPLCSKKCFICVWKSTLTDMNNHPVFNSVRELISQGDADQALQVLIAFLEKDGAHPESLHTLRVVEANYRAARKKETKGILDFSEAQREYAKTNDALVSILDDLIAGRKPVPGFKGPGDGGSRNVLLPWLVGGSILLLVGILAGLWFTRSSQKDEDQKLVANEAALQCPKFRPEGFKVLVLEFQKLSGAVSKPELGIQTRIRDLTERNKVVTDVKILSEKSFDSITPSLQEATALGSQCQADMVIWGQYEPLDNSISVDIRYAFTAADWPPGVAMETFKNVTEIKADQMKITNLDEAVFRLCTAMALHENRIDLAEKWLNKLQQPNNREIEWKKMLEKKWPTFPDYWTFWHWTLDMIQQVLDF